MRPEHDAELVSYLKKNIYFHKDWLVDLSFNGAMLQTVYATLLPPAVDQHYGPRHSAKNLKDTPPLQERSCTC